MWSKYLDEATKALWRACYSGATLPATERETAAATFCSWIEKFQAGGPMASVTLLSALTDTDVYRRHAAARILTELPDPAAQVGVLATFIERRNLPLGDKDIYRLGSKLPLWEGWEDAWQWLSTANPGIRRSLTSALLRYPTERGRAFIEQALKDNDEFVLEGVTRGVARWNEPEILRRVMSASPNPLTECQLDAAFYLSLAGEHTGIAFLENVALGSSDVLAAQATIRLAYLARPEAINPIAVLLESEDLLAVALALNAAADLGAADLVPVVLRLAARSPLLHYEGQPLQDNAIRWLRDLTGQELPWEEMEFNLEAVEEEYTDATRHKAVALYQATLPSLDLLRRYHRGKLLKLSHLVEDLLSPHTGPMRAAAYNLRAITGEDYGFDPDNDLIANLPAITAWRKRAMRPAPIEPGGWAFAGVPLPDPLPLERR